MIEIDHITLQALCHATESEDKVLEALHVLYPHFRRREATGHFGNPIYIFEAQINRKREIRDLLSLIKKELAPQLEKNMRRRIDRKGNLYIRVDKQELARRNLVVEDRGDVKITIRIQSYPFRLEDAIQYAEDIFGH
ncbi:MAG: hypothetical protein HXS52_06940 [Theionarchaea archaeon]|nr:hypothetical protein [Theionarchaea archaeon]MBU7037651.1 hypothetical protein [Theionarchaea archaeon]